jgi:DHA2 family multidrug resistance protein
MAQGAHADMSYHITPSQISTIDPNVLQTFGNQAASITAFLNAEITRQALFIAYLDDFKLMMWISFLVLPLLLLMRNSRKQDETPLVLD